MISYYLMFPVVRSSLVFSGLGLKSPASGFQSYSSSSLKSSPLLQLYSTDNKTSRLNEKILHSEGHPKTFTQLHEEEEREEGARDTQEEKKGGLKRRETDIHSTLFPKCSP